MASILTKESINFARNHIDSFYDTDFFPKPFEFKAIWFKWEAVVELLISKKLEQTFEAPPVAAPWKKTRGGLSYSS